SPLPGDSSNHTYCTLQSKATALPKAPPYHPFATLDNFDQAQILIKNTASDGHITEQLQLNARRFGAGNNKPGAPENARELHELLAHAVPAGNLMLFGVEYLILWLALQFKTHKIVTEFKGHTFTHEVRSRSLWEALKESIKDPDLSSHLTWLPEQRFVRSRCSAKPTPTLEESWHGQDWWDAQV
ncbi:hypothetical protein FRC10_007235, partial [Ceratobasidium sp. 414]